MIRKKSPTLSTFLVNEGESFQGMRSSYIYNKEGFTDTEENGSFIFISYEVSFWEFNMIWVQLRNAFLGGEKQSAFVIFVVLL